MRLSIIAIGRARTSVEGALLIDTHDAQVRTEVWELYAETVAQFGARSTMIAVEGQ